MIKIYIFINFLLTLCSGKIQMQIGGIFHEKQSENEIAFLAAIHSINVVEKQIKLVPNIKYIPETNTVKAANAVCELAGDGVVAIIGPFSKQTIGIVEAVCNKLGIPHFIMQWKAEPLMYNTTYTSSYNNMTINMYPDSNLLAKAYADIIVDSDWAGYSIIYENEEGLMRMKNVLQAHDSEDKPITVRELGPDIDNRPVLKQIQKSGSGSWDIILECNSEKILNLLNQAKDLGMIGEYQRFFLFSLDTHSLDFRTINLHNANITSVRLISFDQFALNTAANDFNEIAATYNIDYHIRPENMKTIPALIYDSITIFIKVLKKYFEDNEEYLLNELEVPSFDCDAIDSKTKKWKMGDIFVKSFKKKKFVGITGPMSFNEGGVRTQFGLDIIELSRVGNFTKTGQWSLPGNIKYIRSQSEVIEKAYDILTKKKVIVCSKLGEPFLMKRKSNDTIYEGNAQFEGYIMDLLDEISKVLNFSYTVELVPDGTYGVYDKVKQEWSGMVRHIMDRKADIGIGDLTVTYDRRRFVDFTMPFMTLGISILFSKPLPKEKNFFSFLLPFSPAVWSYIAVAVFLLTFLIYALGRMSADEWENPHPFNEESDERESPWNIKNSTWLVIGTLMQQGCDILPKGVPIRIICGLWWFFTLIMLSSYTANMAAFLTMDRMDNAIENVEELADQPKIKYGVLADGSTAGFFKYSNNSLYQKMWTVMEQTQPSPFCTSNQEGIDRVAKSKRTYAFFVESSILEFALERNCDLQQIGRPLDSKGYAIALPMNSLFRKPLNSAILKLQELGVLEILKKRWWKDLKGVERKGDCNRRDEKLDGEASLEIDNVGGVFLVLFAGCMAGLLIGIFEFLWNVKDVAVQEKLTPSEAFKKEIKFAFNLSYTTKPVLKSCNSSNSQISYSRSQTSSQTNEEQK